MLEVFPTACCDVSLGGVFVPELVSPPEDCDAPELPTMILWVTVDVTLAAAPDQLAHELLTEVGLGAILTVIV